MKRVAVIVINAVRYASLAHTMDAPTGSILVTNYLNVQPLPLHLGQVSACFAFGRVYFPVPPHLSHTLSISSLDFFPSSLDFFSGIFSLAII